MRDLESGATPSDASVAVRPHIRTFHARHGRLSVSMRLALSDLGPTYAPAWQDLAGPVVLEVGCGNGEAALAYAAHHPSHHVVAIDVYRPGIGQLLQAVAAGVPNVSVLPADAVEVLTARVAPASLAGVHLFFPDPWPKARHRKRRFVRPDVLDLLASRLAPGGSLLVATDADDYARSIVRFLGEHPAFLGGPSARPQWRPVTTYEARARDDHRSIHEFAYRRVDDTSLGTVS